MELVHQTGTAQPPSFITSAVHEPARKWWAIPSAVLVLV